MSRERLADLRLATALAHAVPECVVRVSSPCGRAVCIGFRPVDGVCMTPCALRTAVSLALRRDGESTLARILGLPRGPLRTRVLPEGTEQRHVGLGVYRHDCTNDRGFLFATLLQPAATERALRAALAEAREEGGAEACALGRAEVKVLHDPEIAASVVLLACPAESELPDGACALAIRLAAACAVAELLGELAP